MSELDPQGPDAAWMAQAARLALRGHGGAEPNPMVGCVIVAQGVIVGWGYHRRCGGPHAEIAALARAGDSARGADVYVTLEPCNHTGRTGPCAEALINAGVARVVIGQPDPNPDASGGAARLTAAGIAVEFLEGPGASVAARPFCHRVATGRPYVIAKWAQTLDGWIATESGSSKWISGERSRSLVHRERGRVDAILTGIGTVLADDPRLTARTRHARRTPRRIVIDPSLRTPLDSRLVATIDQAPLTIAVHPELLAAGGTTIEAFRERGAELMPLDDTDTTSLSPVLERLATQYDVTTVLVEAGSGLLSSLFAQSLVSEAWIFIAPKLLGDERSRPPITARRVNTITDGMTLSLIDQRRRGDDIVARYLVGEG